MAAAAATLSILVTILGSAIGGFYCPPGWHMFGKSCFWWSDGNSETWHQAMDTCVSMNATLAVISSQKENDFVSNRGPSSTGTWIGLHVEEPGGPFVLANDSKTTPVFTRWAADQPNSGAINCVYLAKPVYRQYEHGWGDYYCRKQYPFICQKAKGSSRCDDTWLSQGSKCYRVNSTDVQDWFKAREFCQQEGGDLAVIDNAKDNQFLTVMLHSTSRAWIGLWDQHMDFRWRWLDKPGKPTWTDWIRGEPKNSKKTLPKHCACAMGYYSRRGRWNGDACISNYKFVCRGPGRTEASCPTGWRTRTLSGVKWCYFVSSELATWAKARVKCKTMLKDADLVKIESYSDTSYIKGMLTGRSSEDCYWVGLTDHHKEGVWAWLDESVATRYTNWYRTPSRRSGQHCVMMHATSRNLGQWMTLRCDRSLGYVCELNKSDCSSNTTNNLIQHGGNCYKVSDPVSTSSWTSAQNMCKGRYGGDLVVIETPGEMAFLKAIMPSPSRVPGFWIGLHDPDMDGLYHWLEDDKIHADYGNWAKGEPHDQPQENCVQSSRSNWYDHDCMDKKPFICKKTVTGGYSFYDFSLGDTAYKAITDHRVPRQTNFTELCTDILGEGAALAVITSQQELATIGQELSLRGVGADSLWLDISDDVGLDKPNPGSCVTMFMEDPGTARFGSDFCCQLKPFLCERHINTTNQFFDFMFNNTIYKFVTVDKKQNSDAKAECKNIFDPPISNGQLAEVSSEAELGALSAEIRARHLGEDLRYWIGSGPVPIETNNTGEPCYVLTYHGYPDLPWDNHHLDIALSNCSELNRLVCQKRLGPYAGIIDASVWEQLYYETTDKKRSLYDYVFGRVTPNCNNLCLTMISVMIVVCLFCFAGGFIMVAASYRWNCSPIARMLHPGRKHGDVMYLHADSVEES